MATTEIAPSQAQDSASGSSRQLVCFVLGDQDFGVPIGRVQEIIRYTPPRPMPAAARDVTGIVNLRGRIIPVLDLRGRLGASGARPEDSKIVIVELAERTLGIEVDEVREVLSVAEADCEPVPRDADSVTPEGIDSVAKLDGRLLVILDLDRLLS